MIYTIWIVSPPNYVHSHAFDEVALSLHEALIEIGHECKIVTSSMQCRGRTIILGANLLAMCSHFIDSWDLPKDLVIYNLEQIMEGSPWITNEYLDLLRGRHGNANLLRSKHRIEVWDYAQSNIDALKLLGIEARLVPVGYMPGLTRIEKREEDIDVLHVGSVTERRMKIINELATRGVKVHFVFGVYGAERDALVARSKIVLNVHFYESKVFEIVRCSYMMANRKCVVSESGIGGDEFIDGICFRDYDDIVGNVVELLDSPRRLDIERKAFEIFSGMSQAEYLRAVL